MMTRAHPRTGECPAEAGAVADATLGRADSSGGINSEGNAAAREGDIGETVEVAVGFHTLQLRCLRNAEGHGA